MAATFQSDTDRWLIDDFVRRALDQREDPRQFWSAFVQAFTEEMHRLPDDPVRLRLKIQLATHWLHAFLCNFYEGSAEVFYWQPGELRQAVYLAAMSLGVQILPLYPYSPAPDPHQLPASFWATQSALPGLRVDSDRCVALIHKLAADFRAEYDALPYKRPPNSQPWTYFLSNGFYSSVDGCILYAMIRHFSPRRIVEIGSGNSTYLSTLAAARNQFDDIAHSCEITAIEPYPNDVLRDGFPGLNRLIVEPVQNVPLLVFEQLDENDILFIDSSHVARTGSDVLYELLEVLPRLRKGVLIHFHDIFLPCEYPRDWVLKMNRYWTEQYLLQAFLAFNDSFEILLPAAYMHIHRPEVLEQAFRCYQRGAGWTPSNFWIQKTR